MRWYKNIYLGDNARKKKSAIIAKAEAHRFQRDIYFIVLSSTEGNLLEMMSAVQLLQPHYRQPYVWEKLFVVGIAKGYDEAVMTMAAVITDTYNATGAFDVAEYLGIRVDA